MTNALQVLQVHGAELLPYIDGVGHLRMSVFRAFPYLYDGTLEYEREYLQSYLMSARSMVLLVLDQDEVVGATTCMPMSEEGPEFQQPFATGGYDVSTICYFGESLLLPRYRGRGLGRVFFQGREAHARQLGAKLTAFCAVDRAPDHPKRPADYQPVDGLWERLGYVKHPELQTTFMWKEIDETAASPKTLTFWLKAWS